jgi:hypothetical protein
MTRVSHLSLTVAERAGVTYRQLDHWTRVGYVRARAREADSSGFLRHYDEAEMAVAVWMARLVQAGILPKSAAGYARMYVETGSMVITLRGGWSLHLAEDGKPVDND